MPSCRLDWPFPGLAAAAAARCGSLLARSAAPAAEQGASSGRQLRNSCGVCRWQDAASSSFAMQQRCFPQTRLLQLKLLLMLCIAEIETDCFDDNQVGTFSSQ